MAVAMEGGRDASYSGKPLEAFAVAKRNRLAAEVATELEIPVLDLHGTFVAHYQDNQQRFEFADDWHWHGLANPLVGAEIARFLLRDPVLSNGPPDARRWPAPRLG